MAVRPWSEEVFSQVDEGRLRWSDSSTIQMLRMSMSRTSTAKINISAPTATKPQSYNDNRTNQPTDRSSANRFKQGHQSNNPEFFKGGPPCNQYNAPQGCNLPSGRIIKGQKMIQEGPTGTTPHKDWRTVRHYNRCTWLAFNGITQESKWYRSPPRAL